MGDLYGGLWAEDYDRTYSDPELLARIWSYFRPHWRAVAGAVVMVGLSSASIAAVPIVVARGIDHLAEDPSVARVAAATAAVALCGSLAWVFNFFRQTLAFGALGDVVLALRRDAFDAVIHRDLSFYDEHPSGKFVSRVTSDTQDFSTVMTLSIELLSQLAVVGVMGGALLVMNWRLALVTLATVPLAIVATLIFRRIARRVTRDVQRANATVNAAIQETVAGMAVAKSFRQEGAIYRDFMATNQVSYTAFLQMRLVFSAIQPTLGVLTAIGYATVITFGGLRVLGGELSLGEWYLFVQSLMFFYYPLASITVFWSQFQQGLSASERVFALIDAEPKVVQVDETPVPRLAGRITFQGVRFSYYEGQTVLPDFSLDIAAGERAALVGHTGAGKTSVVRLIMRFYEFQAGQLLVDGRDIRTLDLAQYRGQIGLVPQSPFLFSGTVADNIRYARPEASDHDVAQAVENLGGDWVADLPRGLGTEVGERGGRLSLGQRQLVALARVLLQDPVVFLLDEATASIDPLTEAQIQEGLDRVMRGRTSLLVAHRLSTVRSADRILVMRAGRIIEEGGHRELLEAGGHYAELYNTYFRHQSLAYRPWEGDRAEPSVLRAAADG